MAVISINQLAEFSSATIAVKKRIIKQQITPNKLLIPWYQQAKSAIKRYFSDISNSEPIESAIKSISTKIPKTDRQVIDKKVSLEALEKIQLLRVPKLLSVLKYELVKPESKSISYGDVNIIVAPDVVIKAVYQEKVVYGAIKIHISKSKPFDNHQAKYVSMLLYDFLTKKVAKKGEYVLPELCLCLDVFSDRLIGSTDNASKVIKEIKEFCLEVKNIWDGLT